MRKTFVIALGLAVVYLMFSFTAMASLGDKKTIFTINQPMEIPGKPAIVLPPGKYVIKLLDLAGSRNIVQFFNADETKLYSTVIGIPDYRLETPDKAEITLYEAEPGRAHPIRAWFSPESNYGVEFVYPKARALEVAKATGQHVMSAANPTTSTPSEQPTPAQIAELKNETVTAATPQGTEISLAEAHPPVINESKAEPKNSPEPVASSGSATTVAPSTSAATVAPNVLPKTAGNLPLFALVGIMLVGAAFSLRALLS